MVFTAMKTSTSCCQKNHAVSLVENHSGENVGKIFCFAFVGFFMLDYLFILGVSSSLDVTVNLTEC